MTLRTGLVAAAAAIAATAAVATALVAAAPAGAQSPDALQSLRAETARFHSLTEAAHAGYTVLPDAAGITCIDLPGVGGMGVHYVNGADVGDGAVDAATPEALVYEPTPQGLRLVALEYVVFQRQWDATHDAPPSLFGHEFGLTPDGNRFGLPAFYELHVWAWKDNSLGQFFEWNPDVVCPAA